ncbi:hypothetical protein J6590_086312 [Homalodisca vitripennis]|nr:hypothetical protein J6590_086312 [Homalodisca vitripennis]
MQGPRECRQRNGAASLPNGSILKPKWNARALPALLYRHPTGAPVFIWNKATLWDKLYSKQHGGTPAEGRQQSDFYCRPVPRWCENIEVKSERCSATNWNTS